MSAARLAAWALLLTPALAFAAFERDLLNPFALALGGSTVAHDAVVSANPAASEERAWASLAYTRPFRVEGLAEQSLRAGTPTPLHALHVAGDFGRFGNDVHSEDTFGVALRGRYRSVSFGGRGVYYHRATEGFRSASAVSPDVGVQARLSPTLTVGATVRRAIESRVIPSREARVGAKVGFRSRNAVSDAGRMFFDGFRREGHTGIAVGGEWRSSPAMLWRFGVHNLPWQWAGGVEIRRYGFAFQYAVQTHPALDATHIVGLTWER